MAVRAKAYFEFRERPYARAWEGHTDAPRVETAVEIRDALLEAYDLPFEEGRRDELHIVYTEFKSMVVQEPKILRLLPIHVGAAKAMGEEIVPDQELTKAEYEQAASLSSSPPLRKCSTSCCRATLHPVSSPASCRQQQVSWHPASAQ